MEWGSFEGIRDEIPIIKDSQKLTTLNSGQPMLIKNGIDRSYPISAPTNTIAKLINIV